MLAKIGRNRNPHTFLVRNTATLESHLAISPNIKYKFMLLLSNSIQVSIQET